MRARKKLKPGQDGTKGLLDKYGAQLICVRYRYDVELQVRHKTVELIVETIPWIPQPEKIRSDAIVGVRVELQEVKLQKQIRQAGGKWNRELRLWEIRYDQAAALELQSRIEPSTLSNSSRVSRRSKSSSTASSFKTNLKGELAYEKTSNWSEFHNFRVVYRSCGFGSG